MYDAASRLFAGFRTSVRHRPGRAVTRRNAILALVGIDDVNAANLNFIAFWRYGPNPEALSGIMVVIFSIAIAAAEAAVGLALIIAIYRHYRTVNLDEIRNLNEAPRNGFGS